MSAWSVYGYGVVAIDKKENANIIEVFLKDRLYGVEGKINKEEKLDLNTKDSEGIVKTEKITTKTTIPARWAALNQPNRTSAPDVRKNETVIVYRYGNNDDYYWDKVFTEDNLRGKETVSYAFKNTDDLVKITADNSYFFTVSTKNKIIQLHTAINDGEKVGYDLVINTKESTVSLKDTRGNYQTLKSLEDDMTITTNKKINLNTADVTINANKSITINSPKGDFNITDLKITSSSHTVNTSNLSVTSPAGTMSSGSSGMNFTKMLICTDLKTNAVASQNGHQHNETNSITSAPIG